MVRAKLLLALGISLTFLGCKEVENIAVSGGDKLSAASFSGKNSATFSVNSPTASLTISAGCDIRFKDYEISKDMTTWSSMASEFPSADLDCTDKQMSFMLSPVNGFLTNISGGSQTFWIRAKTILGPSDFSTVTVLLDVPPSLTVSFARGPSQASPTRTSGVVFHVSFNQAIDVGSFDAADITNSGTFSGSVTWGAPTLVSGNTYQIVAAVSGVAEGTIKPTMAVGRVSALSGTVWNDASASSAYEIDFDSLPPSITSLALQDPATSPGADTTPTLRVAYPSGQGLSMVQLYDGAGCTNLHSTVSTPGASQTDITSSVLTAGTYTFGVKLTDTLGNVSACLGSVGYQYVPPAVLTISDSGYVFPDTTVGGLKKKIFTVSNVGTGTSSAHSEVGLLAPFSFVGGGYPGTGGDCGASLAPTNSCKIEIQFSPSSLGLANGTIALSYFNGLSSQTASIPISGTGIGPAILQFSLAGTWDFGTVPVGSSDYEDLEITNSGTSPADITSISGLSAPFSLPGTGTCGSTLAAGGASCTVRVSFQPTGSALSMDTLDIQYNNGADPVTISKTIQGTGLVLDQVDDDDSILGFGGGTKNQVIWQTGSPSALVVNTVNTLSSFLSRIMNAGSVSAIWNAITWTSREPAGKPLPNSQGSESGYTSGNVTMSTNQLLLHFEELVYNPGTAFENSAMSTPTSLGFARGSAISHASGRFGRALTLEGTDSFASIPHGSGWSGDSGNFSVEFWFRPNQIFGKDGLMSSHITLLDKGGYNFSIGYPDGKLGFNLYKSGGFGGIRNSTPQPAVWSMAEHNGYIYAGTQNSLAELFICNGNSNPGAACTSFLPATVVSAGPDSVRSLAAYNGVLYAGLGGAMGSGQIRYCTPSTGSCDTTTEWSNVSRAATSGDINVHSMVIYKGRLYASYEHGSAGYVVVCNPSNSPSTPKTCEDTDWQIAFTLTGRRSAYQLAVMNDVLYVASGDGTSQAAAVHFCRAADGICDIPGEWSVSKEFLIANIGEEYTDALTLIPYLDRLYVGLQGVTPGRGDITFCRPWIDGDSTVCDTPADWGTCTPNAGGSPGICDVPADYASMKAYDDSGTLLSVESFSVRGGKLYAGFGWGGSSTGQLKACTLNVSGECDTWTTVNSAIPDLSSVQTLFTLRNTMYVGFAGTGGADMAVVNDSGVATPLSSTTPSLWFSKKWYHVAGTFDATSNIANLYIDGTLVDSTTYPAGSVNPSDYLPLRLGKALGPGGGKFQVSDESAAVSIDEVAVYNSALSAAEIADRYRRGANRILHQVRSCSDINCRDQILPTNWTDPNNLNGAATGIVNTGTRLIAVGNFTSPKIGIAAYNLDGTADSTFTGNVGANGFSGGYPFGIHRSNATGKLYVYGSFLDYQDSVSTRGCKYLVRLHPDGSFDSCLSIGLQFNGVVRSVYEDRDGSVWVGGSFTSYNGDTTPYITKLSPNGVRDPVFSAGQTISANNLNNNVFKVLSDGEGGVYVAGSFLSPKTRVAHFHSNGVVDSSFTPGASSPNPTYDLVIDSVGNLYAAGGSSPIVAMDDRTGALRSASVFSAVVNGTIFSLSTDPTGRLFIGGTFTDVNGVNVGRFAALLPNGQVDPSYMLKNSTSTHYTGIGVTGAGTVVNGISVAPSGSVALAGNFTGFSNALTTIPAKNVFVLRENAGFKGGSTLQTWGSFDDSQNFSTSSISYATFPNLVSQFFQYRTLFIRENSTVSAPAVTRVEILPSR